MATFHLITYSSFWPKLLISTLFFGEFFSYFATSWKWYYLTFWIGKKSRLFRRFFQYSVICHFSKYIRLALTDFHKNKVFNNKCMWLQLRQVLKKKSPKETRENLLSVLLFFAHVNVITNRKPLMFSFERAQITWAFANTSTYLANCYLIQH